MYLYRRAFVFGRPEIYRDIEENRTVFMVQLESQGRGGMLNLQFSVNGGRRRTRVVNIAYILFDAER